MRITEIVAYLNPFDTSFDLYSFQELSLEKKVTTVFFTIVGALVLVIGALASFRFCLQQFSVITPKPSPPPSTSESRSEAFGRAIKEGRLPSRKPAKAMDNISLKTKLCKEKLAAFLKRSNEKFGVAVDDGDCFYDAFRQGLKKISVTVKELRTIVHERVQAIHKEQGIKNWIFEALKIDTSTQQEDYDELLKTVSHTKQEIAVPLWGRPHIEGKILADHFKVAIKVCEVNVLDTILPLRQVAGVVDRDTAMTYDLVQKVEGGKRVRAIKICEVAVTEIYPEAQPFIGTVKVAGYPGHFVPVMTL